MTGLKSSTKLQYVPSGSDIYRVIILSENKSFSLSAAIVPRVLSAG
jgi:hypothetical protein